MLITIIVCATFLFIGAIFGFGVCALLAQNHISEIETLYEDTDHE